MTRLKSLSDSPRADDAERAAPIFAWLATEPSADPMLDLPQLAGMLDTLLSADLPVSQSQRALDMFLARALDAREMLVPRLIGRALPLPEDLYIATTRLELISLTLASGYAKVIAGAAAGALPQPRGPEALAQQALGLLSDALWLAGMKGATARAGLWSEAHRIFHVTNTEARATKLSAALPRGPVQGAYKRLLALSAAQPEALTARELDWTVRYLEQCAWRAELSAQPRGDIETWDYWIDPAQDDGPVAMVRRAPPPVDGMLYFSAAELARAATGHLESLERALDAGDDVLPEGDDLPDMPAGLSPTDISKLLRCLRERWAMPPRREQVRRRSQYDVQVCVGLRAVWRMKHAGEAAVHIVDWRVVNESPGGFAIMSVEADPGSLSAGMVLALRAEPDEPWAVCVVRWVRSDSPTQVELGLQIVSTAATPVRIGFRGGDGPGEMLSALVLPPLAGIRRHQAIIAPAGAYRSRRFLMVHEGERLYVAQGRLLSLDMQTASIELFQFEYDPYPV